jgi:hypothetical protein
MMLNRRGFIRTALCGVGATVGAMMAGTVGAKEPTPTITGPDPSTYVHVLLSAEGYAVVYPSMMQDAPWNETHPWLAIPRAEFPEYDPKRAPVATTGLPRLDSGPDDVVAAIRAGYAREIAWMDKHREL